ncbi:MAG: hypothetical protein Q8L04_05055 [Ignavibacteria bacterium]|nr:hypothetical protein [Ignavibacteria bacterium]
MTNYYERLIKSDSICIAMNYSDFEIRRIYFSGKDSILNIGSLIEGNRESYIVESPNELYVAKSPFFRNPYTLSLVAKKGKTFVTLHEIKESSNDTIFYVSLPKEYSTSHGFEHFINDKSFTGTYLSEDQKLRLNFSQDGKVEGLEDFNRYIVHSHTLTNFDIVTFQKKSKDNIIKGAFEKIVENKSFHWRKVGKDIWLYNLSDKHGFGEVTTLFTKLKKVD